MRTTQTIRMIVILAAGISASVACAAGPPSSLTHQEAFVRAQAEGVKAEAALMQARSGMITAISQSRKLAADTRKVHEECRGLEIKNDVEATKAFYDKRSQWEAYRSNHVRVRPNAEALLRYAKQAAPPRMNQVRLISTGGGAIQWPAVLQREEFSEHRLQLDVGFSQRSLLNSGVGSDLFRHVHEVTKQMRKELLAHIREMSPMEYVQAKKFIDSLEYEAQFPQHLESVAKN